MCQHVCMHISQSRFVHQSLPSVPASRVESGSLSVLIWGLPHHGGLLALLRRNKSASHCRASSGGRLICRAGPCSPSLSSKLIYQCLMWGTSFVVCCSLQLAYL